MPLQEGPCQEAGDWAVRVLGGMVLLCLASHAVSLLRRPPRGSSRRASRRRHSRAPRGERPPAATLSAASCRATRRQKPPSRPSSPPRSSDRSSAWLAAAPSRSPPPPPRPARVLVCSVRREASVVGRAPLGQVIYDARRPPRSAWKCPLTWLR